MPLPYAAPAEGLKQNQLQSVQAPPMLSKLNPTSKKPAHMTEMERASGAARCLSTIGGHYDTV